MQKIFSYTSVVNASCEEVYAYYNMPAAFYRVIPPWEHIQRVDTDDMQELGTMARVHFGGNDWISQIIESKEPYGFTQRLLKGPLAPTTYEHHFKRLSAEQTEVTDRLIYTVPHGAFGKWFLQKKAEHRVKKMITYRHTILREDLKHMHQDKHQKPLKILLSGASGLVGKHLTYLFPLFRHHVYTLVRHPPKHLQEIYWDPYTHTVDLKQLEGFDAVIHLSGEPVGALRWTDKKKEAIHKSRVFVTDFLAQSLNALHYPPKTLLCASAVGFYGDCQGQHVDETAPQGRGFLAEVCNAWEESAQKFTKGRVVRMRLGVVLALGKGFLSKWITPFKMGLGHIMGEGKESWSWISLEDLGYQILHLLRHQEISGIVNMTTPYPTTSVEFSRALGRVLDRPVWIKIPKMGVKMLFGEMGSSLFLSSTAALPRQLEQSGALFSYPHLTDALTIYLGS